MSAVEPGFGVWLGSTARFVESSDAAAVARWGTGGTTVERLSPLAERSAAVIEARRQRLFASGPLARDRHVVPGLRRDLIGRVVRLTIDQLGYAAGISCFVIGCREREGAEVTELVVLRRL